MYPSTKQHFATIHVLPNTQAHENYLGSTSRHLFSAMRLIVAVLLVVGGTWRGVGQTLSARVLDQETQEPIAFAEVYFVDLEAGTTTDLNGIFHIEHFAQKMLHLQITYVGYQTLDVTVPVWASGKPRIFYLVPSHFKLEEVVVSALGSKLQRDNVVSIAQMKVEEIQRTNPLTLAQALSNIPGVEQNNTGVGIGKPVIRGLSGNRIVTYADGIRVENQQWGEEHGLGVGDIGIDRVEVIKGPASLLYGSDALGGVLYFVSERYAEHNSIEGFVESKAISSTWGSLNKLGLKYHKGALKYNVFGAYDAHSDYEISDGQRLSNSRFDAGNIKTAVGFNKGPWITNLRYSFLRNNFGIVEEALYGSSRKKNFELPFQRIDDHKLSWENTFVIGASKLEATIGTSYNYRQEFEDDASAAALGLKLRTTTYDAKWHSPVWGKHFDFVFGLQGMSQSNVNTGMDILIPDARTKDIGGFSVMNAAWGRWQFQAGVRADRRHILTREDRDAGHLFPAYDHSFSGVTYSAGAVYSESRHRLRWNISSGFRAPTTSELLSDGVHEGTVRYEMGSLTLRAEHATQIDASWDYKREHLSISVDPFYNFIQDYVHLTPTNETKDNFPVFRYLQSQATLYGGELGVHYHPHQWHWLHVQSNYSMVRAEDQAGSPLPLIPQNKINTTLAAELSTPGRINIKRLFVQHIYKFAQDRIGLFETPTPSYHLINTGIKLETAYRGAKIECRAGINNILNKAYIDHLSRFKPLGIPAPGRNIYLGVKIHFQHALKG